LAEFGTLLRLGINPSHSEQYLQSIRKRQFKYAYADIGHISIVSLLILRLGSKAHKTNHTTTPNMTIQQKIEKLTLVKIPSKKGFQGQSWGGADVMIILNDENTFARYAHFQGQKLITKYAYEIGYLYKKLRPIIAEHPHFSSLSKLEFWGLLTEELVNIVEKKPDIDLESLKAQLITSSLNIMKKWDSTS